jgi:hypothetical protein
MAHIGGPYKSIQVLIRRHSGACFYENLLSETGDFLPNALLILMLKAVGAMHKKHVTNFLYNAHYMSLRFSTKKVEKTYFVQIIDCSSLRSSKECAAVLYV